MSRLYIGSQCLGEMLFLASIHVAIVTQKNYKALAASDDEP